MAEKVALRVTPRELFLTSWFNDTLAFFIFKHLILSTKLFRYIFYAAALTLVFILPLSLHMTRRRAKRVKE